MAPRVKRPSSMARGPTSRSRRVILVLEDDGATQARRRLKAVGDELSERVTVRLHSVADGEPHLVAEQRYRAGTMTRRGRAGKGAFVLRMIEECSAADGAVLVAGSAYGSNGEFLDGLSKRRMHFIAEVRASELRPGEGGRNRSRLSRPTVERLLRVAHWHSLEVTIPSTHRMQQFSAALLPGAIPHHGVAGRLFAAQTGRIGGVHRGTVFGFTSLDTNDLEDLVTTLLWTRWIRTKLRRDARGQTNSARATSIVVGRAASVTVRANITLAAQQDDRLEELSAGKSHRRGVLGGHERHLNIVELFAGAGGMGLGFLLASGRGYKLIFSGEVNPIYVATLRRNHDLIATRRTMAKSVPAETRPVDLRSGDAHDLAASIAQRAGGVDILIGGPPCQGFSNANRNSWSRENPNNKLVDVFISYVEKLTPPLFVMENVQGILWTSKGGRSDTTVSIVDHLARRLKRAGYDVFPRLLDAVWFGVPQFRSRFFLVGIHRDLGYHPDDFGPWGPFPRPTHGTVKGRPYVTVREAIGDLPRLGNGEGGSEIGYHAPTSDRIHNQFLSYVRSSAPRDVIHEHVTSRHADYVIERYRRIPPGGNWEDIADTMSNYADVGRTHSNIYRRLKWDQPAITIGHYRKSMLVHPRQHRGLSLREASRLQSFPDWFRFAGNASGEDGGLVHKQQQLANAVCPLVTKAIAEFFRGI